MGDPAASSSDGPHRSVPTSQPQRALSGSTGGSSFGPTHGAAQTAGGGPLERDSGARGGSTSGSPAHRAAPCCIASRPPAAARPSDLRPRCASRADRRPVGGSPPGPCRYTHPAGAMRLGRPKSAETPATWVATPRIPLRGPESVGRGLRDPHSTRVMGVSAIRPIVHQRDAPAGNARPPAGPSGVAAAGTPPRLRSSAATHRTRPDAPAGSVHRTDLGVRRRHVDRLNERQVHRTDLGGDRLALAAAPGGADGLLGVVSRRSRRRREVRQACARGRSAQRYEAGAVAPVQAGMSSLSRPDWAPLG